MSKLAEYLQAQLRQRNWTLRIAEEQTQMSRETLSRIMRGDERAPRLDTLQQVAEGFDLPLWRVIELAGYDIGIQSSPATQAARLEVISRAMPHLAPLLDRLLEASPDDLDAILVYLEALQMRRARHNSAQ
jgi:transcriptional regulator with XRE-family HTH domain